MNKIKKINKATKRKNLHNNHGGKPEMGGHLSSMIYAWIHPETKILIPKKGSRSMKLIAKTILALPFALLYLPSFADETVSTQTLDQKIQALQNQYDQQRRSMQMLEIQIQQVEQEAQALNPQEAKKQKASGTEKTSTSGQTQPNQPVQQTQNSAEVVKEPPKSRSAETVYQEQHTDFNRKFSFEAGLTYSRFDRRQIDLSGFLALDAIFLGHIAVDDIKSDILTLDLTGRYTFTPRSQISVDAPFLWRSTEYLSGGSGSSGTTLQSDRNTSPWKVGDVSIGYYYQVLPETATRPDVVWNAQVKFPTGTDPYGIKIITVPGTSGNLQVPQSLPTGNGLYAVSTGLSLIKTVDPAILFADINIYHTFSRHFPDISTTPGNVAPGDVQLGDSIEGDIGTAFALNDKMSLSLSYQEQITKSAETRLDGQAWQGITGSSANAAVLNLGATYATTPNNAFVFNLGAGLTPDAPNVLVGLKIVHQY
ncbi:MAG TPA: hypothetical protein VND43_04660 [Burkholderiales bacterium]|nr:hypothetical protein [Burkholderiales bacterium]